MGLLKLAAQSMNTEHGKRLGQSQEDIKTMNCSMALKEIMCNDDYQREQFNIYVASGKTINDLGLYTYCLSQSTLKYALVIVQSLRDDPAIETKAEVMFGLCIPT